MPYFKIHGHPSCRNFGHAIIVAQYLSQRLPKFEYKKVEVATAEWGEYLIDINRENNWYVTKSPLIWKEIHHWGGKKYLIGGLGEFWEYVYCYYGLESKISKSELQNLTADNMKFFEEKVNDSSERAKNVRIISIIGATNLMTNLLLNYLFEVPHLAKKDGIIVRLFDENSRDERKYKIMEDIAVNFNSQGIFGSDQIIFIVSTLKELVEDCELMIIVEDFRPHKGNLNQPEVTQKKNFAKMNFLADAISTTKQRNLRIVLANEGPSCFLATCLVEFCPAIRPSDIVVVTASEGLSYINVMSEKTGVSVPQICAPPVWGFFGMYSFVDVAQTVFKADVYRPNHRSLTAPHGSTLPLGTIKSELRLMSYLIADHEEIVRTVEEKRKKMTHLLEHPAIHGKIRSTINLLKLWYAQQPSDDIISLGVCSNGSFNIPPGIVFSQPVILDSKSRWVPFTEFPLMNDFTRRNISECVESTVVVLKEFGLSQHTAKDNVETCPAEC